MKSAIFIYINAKILNIFDVSELICYHEGFENKNY